ncbi:MAG: AMP-binding protein [Planctomycetes bacterium]|nr:AMP-binding protein [Planctomycetota bacterium]
MTETDRGFPSIRSFPSTPEFRQHSRLHDPTTRERMYAESLRDPGAFWSRVGRELPWQRVWTRAFEASENGEAHWFVGARSNASTVCLDQHIESLSGGRLAVIHDGERTERRTLTYTELHVEVGRFANALAALGVARGTPVAIHLPAIPELVVAMLACARLGAPHAVLPWTLSSDAFRERVRASGCELVVTTDLGDVAVGGDGVRSAGPDIAAKAAVDAALAHAPSVRHVVVVRRGSGHVPWVHGRDVWFHDVVASASDQCPPAALDSDAPLCVLHGADADRGVVHATGGYVASAYLSAQYAFDLREGDVLYCTAEPSTAAWHAYGVYGALANGVTIVLHDGAPNGRAPARQLEVAARHRATVLCSTADTLRALARDGAAGPRGLALESLRLLGSLGAPLDPATWLWFRTAVGGERCPVVDAWCSPESGSILFAPLPGVDATKPGSSGRPFFGVEPVLVDALGREVPQGTVGRLLLARPWPSRCRGAEARASAERQRFDTGVFARCDADGDYWFGGSAR